MTHSTFNIGKLFQYKDRQFVLYSVGVVCQLTCSCSQDYVGQTKRNMNTHLNDHRIRQSSEICKHLKGKSLTHSKFSLTHHFGQ